MYVSVFLKYWPQKLARQEEKNHYPLMLENVLKAKVCREA